MAPLTPPGYETLRDVRRRDCWEDDGGKLQGLLVTGRLPAYRVDRAGVTHLIQKEYWETAHINQVEDEPVFLTADLDREIPDRWAQTAAGRRARKLIERATDSQKEETAESAVVPKNRGGRPLRDDWDIIWVEMCAFIDREGPPDTYASLANFIDGWFRSKFKKRTPPATSALQAKAKLLIDRIRNDQGLPPIT